MKQESAFIVVVFLTGMGFMLWSGLFHAALVNGFALGLFMVWFYRYMTQMIKEEEKVSGWGELIAVRLVPWIAYKLHMEDRLPRYLRKHHPGNRAEV